MSSIRQRRVPDEPNAAQRAATNQPASRKRPRYSDTLLVAAAPILLTLQVFVVRVARVRMQLTPCTLLTSCLWQVLYSAHRIYSTPPVIPRNAPSTALSEARALATTGYLSETIGHRTVCVHALRHIALLLHLGCKMPQHVHIHDNRKVNLLSDLYVLHAGVVIAGS